MEIWRDIKGYESVYQISSLGRIKTKGKIRRRKVKGESNLIPFKIHKPNYDTRGYNVAKLQLNGNIRMFKVHRLVYQEFKGELIEGLVIDHIDNDQNNNNENNLQQISQRENSHKNPSKSFEDKTSKYVGVHFDKNNNKWVAQIRINGKCKFLGRHETELGAFLVHKKEMLTLR